MRFNCGTKQKKKTTKRHDWCMWFAWHPVRLGSNDCRWLEYVERKGDFFGKTFPVFLGWKYREATK